MKTVKQTCVLAENALSIDVSDQVEQLDELIDSEGNGWAFYDKTFITDGMRSLLSGTIERLAGKSSNAVFHLKQAMGGGKTHLIVGAGLVAKHADLRQSVCADIPHIHDFEDARVVAFNGRNTPENYLWGEIAHQLGEGEKFKKFWAQGPDAPSEQDWIEILKSDTPTLILLDELPPYFQILGTKQTGTGTVADIATRAFANMLSAAGKLSNVCIVVSDLNASYAEGGRSITRALQDARNELGRQEKTITPVDLAGNEIYDILRKRLFKELPDQAEIDDIASRYGQALSEASKSKVLARGAEALADEISRTYPFHPRLKDLVALFKENEQFKQTRGLMELISRLLKSVWEGDTGEVYLIGAQHFDLSIADVRSKLADISGMGDVIAKDIFNADRSAHAQLVDAEQGNRSGSEVANLILIASLSTAVNAVRGLARTEILECLVTPVNSVSEYNQAFDELLDSCWYLHHSKDDEYYFDRQENLTKMLQSIAESAPDALVEKLVKDTLESLFAPKRKVAYNKVIAQPTLDDAIDEVKRNRVLLIIDPDSKMPPAELMRFYESLIEKNNLLVLTGGKTKMASINQAARKQFAVLKADSRLGERHAQREDYEIKREQAEQDFVTTLLEVFDVILYPEQPGKRPEPELRQKNLDTTRDQKEPFDGELQIEKTLTSAPRKLFVDIEGDFDELRVQAETILWNQGKAEIDWSTAVAREKQRPKMAWLPPRGLDTLKNLALAKGVWEDLGNGHVTHTPPKKKTGVFIADESTNNDEGVARLQITPTNAGPSARIHYQEDGPVSQQSPVLKDDVLETKALRVQFLAVDPNGQFETGDSVAWQNHLTIRANQISESPRQVELLVAPTGNIRYTLDGSEPRNGNEYTGPIEIGDDDALILAFAEASGLEARQKFPFSAVSKGNSKGEAPNPTLSVDMGKPVTVNTKMQMSSRSDAYRAVDFFKTRAVSIERVRLAAGRNPAVASVSIGEILTTATSLETLMNHASDLTGPDSDMVLSVGRAHFSSGQDLMAFIDDMSLVVDQSEVEQ